MPSCSSNNANLDKTNFDMFTMSTNYNIAVQPSTAEYEWTVYFGIMLSCTEMSFVISILNFEKFGVKAGFPFTQLNQATY